MKAPMPKVNPDLESFLPRPNEDLLAGLQRKIIRDGVREPIFVAEDGDILDGYSRFGIYQMLKLKFPIEVIRNVKTLAEKKAWMRDHQLSRRNLSSSEFNYYLGLKFEEEKGERFEVENNGNSRAPSSATVADEHTADRLAKETGVPVRTVERSAEFARAVDAQPSKVRPALIAGDVPMKAVTAAAKTGDKLFCDRCTRVGPVKKCPKCAELRAKPKPKEKPVKKGGMKIDWKQVDQAVGVVVRLSDRMNEHYRDKIVADDRKDYEKAVAVVVKVSQAWKKGVGGR